MTEKLIRTEGIETESWKQTHNQLIVPSGVRGIHDGSIARWRLLWNHRRFLRRVTGIAVVCSAALAFVIPTRYRSTVQLMPPDQSGSGMGMAMLAAATSGIAGGGGGSQMGGGLGSIAGDLLGMKNTSDLFVGILQSRTVQDDLINKFNLRKEYWDKKIEDTRDDLDKHTDLVADRKTGIITIKVTDHDPAKAAAMASEYVAQLNEVVAHLNTSAAHRERVFLETRLSQVSEDLESAEKTFSVFASKNTAIDIQAQEKAMLEAGAELEGQLIAAQTELQGLRQIYSDGNVRVRATQARIDEIQRQLKNMSGKYDDGSKPETPSESGEQSLYPPIRRLPILGVNYADLYRNAKVQEALFEVLTKEYELAKVQEAKETPSVKVLDAADIPEKKSFPPRSLIVAVGAILGFIGAMLFVLGRTQWEEVGDEDARKVFALEVYSTVRARMTRGIANGSGSSNGQGPK
jgi:uncharacterized protein involved in exopolysaccharide biosynthesis